MLNARYDDEAGVVERSGSVHLGIATQTDAGLMVPVVRDAQDRNVWQLAAEIARLAEAARSGTASSAELGGSTLTLTSLGPLGGIATTPIINRPEVAIIGPNKIVERPVFAQERARPGRVAPGQADEPVDQLRPPRRRRLGRRELRPGGEGLAGDSGAAVYTRKLKMRATPDFDFGLGENAMMIRDAAARFAHERIAPLAAAIDAEDRFPARVLAGNGRARPSRHHGR